MTKPICNLQELTVQGHDIAELLRIEDPDGAHDGFDKFFLQRAKEPQGKRRDHLGAKGVPQGEE